MAGSVSAASGLMPGCRGRQPPAKQTYSPPLPAGKGVGGMGAKKKSKGRVGRRQSRHAPRRVPQRQGRTAAKQTRPPPGTTAARQDGGKAVTPPPPPETTRKVRNRVQTAAPDNKISGKVLGGLGASFKKPPTLLRFPASPLLCSPSPADYPFRLQSCMALFTSPETRHSIPRQATGKRSERRESSEGEKSERTQAARS